MRTKHLPVQKNEYREITIDDISHEGNGVGKVDGYTLFVKDALPGERVKVKVVKTKSHYGYARLIEVLRASPHRVAPACPIYQQCGGCQLQHMEYQEQLRVKWKMVRDKLQRIGGLDLEKVLVHPPLGMKEPWRYRNKAQIPVNSREGGLVSGFYKQGSHEIIEMDACLIQHEQNDQLVNQVTKIAEELGISGYDERKHSGLLRHVVVKHAFHTGQTMIVLISNGTTLPKEEVLVERITKQFPDVKSIMLNVNKNKTNVIFGEETRLLWGEKYIYDFIGPIQFAISARSFYQINPIQTKVLYEQALTYAALQGDEIVIDAYCGIGTISLFLAQKARKVLGVEIVPEAIADAKRNAKLNGLDHVEFAVGRAESVIPWWQAQGVKADVIVVDPPRKGCDAVLLETMIQMKSKRIVYVSCNPSTLARDLKVLEAGGYETKEVQPVDMFPHTVHVECVVLMSRVEK